MAKFLVVEVQEEITRLIWHYEGVEADSEAEAIEKVKSMDAGEPEAAGTRGDSEYGESGWAAGEPMNAFGLAEKAEANLDEILDSEQE